jgi:hypothetical protein
MLIISKNVKVRNKREIKHISTKAIEKRLKEDKPNSVMHLSLKLKFIITWRFLIPLRSITNDKSKWRFLRPLRYRRNDNHLYIEPGDEGGGFAAAFIPLIYIKQCHPDARVFCGQRDLNFTFFVISLQAFGQMLKLGMTIVF